MAPTILPITPGFAAEVGDIDLSQALSPETERIVRDAFAKYAVLVFTGQTLTPEQHLAFARLFGPHERSVATVMPGQKLRIRQELADIANMTADGEVWDAKNRMRMFQMGNRLWHVDSSFKQPTGYTSMLYCKSVVPIGGHTEFADTRAAWDTLSDEMKRKVEGLIAEHSLLFSRKRLGFTDFSEQEQVAWKPLPRPLVRTIPESGRRALYLASHIGRIRGMADDEAEALLQQLMLHATDRRITYLHRWRVGDLVLWDNRCTMHRGTEFDDTRYPRDMQRATTEDKPDAFAAELRAAGVAA